MTAGAGTVPGLRLARVAFTGALASMTRREAREVARRAGAVPVEDVSRSTTFLVVGMDGWPLLPDGALSRKLRRADDLNRAGAQIRIVPETAFLEMAGLAEPPPSRKSFPAAELCRVLGCDEATLRRCELLGLVRSQDGRFDFQDMVSLRTVLGLVASGVSPRTIGRSIRGLASVLPGTDRPLSQLTIIVEHREALLAELGGLLLAPDGQLLLDFGGAGGGPPRTGPVPLPQSPDALVERGRLLEDREQLRAAEDAYRRALDLDPGLAAAHFNLGNVLRDLGAAGAAERSFRSALEADAAMAEAWYNLADVCEESGRLDEAVAALRRAVALRPDFADAHHNLAWCLARLGRS
jgi:tetratricopeptide (TPR) repeat protein